MSFLSATWLLSLIIVSSFIIINIFGSEVNMDKLNDSSSQLPTETRQHNQTAKQRYTPPVILKLDSGLQINGGNDTNQLENTGGLLIGS